MQDEKEKILMYGLTAEQENLVKVRMDGNSFAYIKKNCDDRLAA